jgi:hypothetical protein
MKLARASVLETNAATATRADAPNPFLNALIEMFMFRFVTRSLFSTHTVAFWQQPSVVAVIDQWPASAESPNIGIQGDSRHWNR